jgi:FkbM family methyltransferase
MSAVLAKASKYLRRIDFSSAIYWRLRGTRPVTIRGRTVEFRTDSIGESVVVGFSLDTERAVVADLLEELRDDDVFYDVGANYVFFCCFTASVLGGDRVYAFEPYSPNVTRLRKNHELNETNDVRVVEKALSDTGGEVPFDSPSRYRTVTGTSGMRQADGGGYTVEAIAGDAFCDRADVSPPTVLKVDVEGAEMKVLRGCSETLSDPACRTIYCEIHADEVGTPIGDYDATPADVRSLLQNCGFSLETLQKREGEMHVKGTKE